MSSREDTYRLQYFNITAKAELTRYILKYAGIDFQDDRSPSDGNWAGIKPTTPFGQVPVLSINEKHALSGSQAIARYLAEKFNLAGSDELENAKLHSILDATDDVLTWLARIKYEKDEKTKETLIETTSKMLAFRLQKFEDRIGLEGFVFGKKLTYVDFAVHLMINNIVQTDLFPNIMDSFPKFVKLRDSVAALPAIDKWIKERPPCEYYKLKQ